MEVTPNYNHGSQSIMVCCNPGSLVVADVQKYMKNTIGRKAELQFSTVSLNVDNNLNDLIEVTLTVSTQDIKKMQQFDHFCIRHYWQKLKQDHMVGHFRQQL